MGAGVRARVKVRLMTFFGAMSVSLFNAYHQVIKIERLRS